MADWFLIVTIVVAIVVLAVAGIYLIANYQHPDDKNDAYFPKLTVLLGFMLAAATVLLLPLDVANNGGYSGCDGFDTKLCGGLNMALFWNIFFWAIPIFIFFLIPFMTFFYEADDGMLMAGTSVGANPTSRIGVAVKYELGVLFVFGVIFAVCYILLSEAAIPVANYTGSVSVTPINVQGGGGAFEKSMLGNMTDDDKAYFRSVKFDETKIEVPVGPGTFFAAFMAFFGWFFFAIFGGIGLAALPLDLILTFVRRPRHMDAVEFAEVQVNIRERVNDLVDVGELLKIEREENNTRRGGAQRGFFSRLSKAAQEERKTFLEFKKAVYLLEGDIEHFNNSSSHFKNNNPLVPYFALAFGILSIIISLLWILQIVINVLPVYPWHPFLNDYLRWFEGWFPPFGVIFAAIFSMYLLLCALKGCFKFGLRFVFIELHPMKLGKTYMSSFMFNIALVLLCALPVVQFTTTAFSDYARFTTIYQVMGIQVKYMKFFNFFWEKDVFVYALLIMAGLTSIYLFCWKKKDESKSSIALRDRIRAR